MAAIALAGLAVFPVFFVSSTPIMLLVSAVLGFWWGFLVATIGTAIGMLLAFLVGKQIFHDRLHRCAAFCKFNGGRFMFSTLGLESYLSGPVGS